MGVDVKVLRDSFALMAGREPELTHRFYDRLFERHPQVMPMFQRRSRHAQDAMLADALVAVIGRLEDVAWLTRTLHAMGARHATYGVTDEMYDWVGECLLATFAAAAGKDWTPRVAGAWSGAYGLIASLMKQGARHASVSPPEQPSASPS
jgi:hemoglobin-like flavoprotein